MCLKHSQRHNDSKSSHTLSQELRLDTLRKARGSICWSTSSTWISTGESESRGEHHTHRCCYITSMMLSLLGFLSHRFMLSLGGSWAEGWGYWVFCYFQGKQGCIGIQRAWLRLICLETHCSHIHSPVLHRPRQESLCVYIAEIHLAGETNYTCLLGNLSMSVISTPSPLPLGY